MPGRVVYQSVSSYSPAGCTRYPRRKGFCYVAAAATPLNLPWHTD